MAKKTVIADPLDEIKATRGGRTQTFKRAQWDLLGPVKQGWEEVKSTPAELQKESTSQDEGKPVQLITVNPQNAFAYMKSVSLYLHAATEEERQRLFELLGTDSDLIALGDFDEFDKQIVETAKPKAANVSTLEKRDDAQDSAVVKTLNKAQQKKADVEAKTTTPEIIEPVTNAETPAVPVTTDADALAQSLANQEGNTDGEAN